MAHRGKSTGTVNINLHAATWWQWLSRFFNDLMVAIYHEPASKRAGVGIKVNIPVPVTIVQEFYCCSAIQFIAFLPIGDVFDSIGLLAINKFDAAFRVLLDTALQDYRCKVGRGGLVSKWMLSERDNTDNENQENGRYDNDRFVEVAPRRYQCWTCNLLGRWWKCWGNRSKGNDFVQWLPFTKSFVPGRLCLADSTRG